MNVIIMAAGIGSRLGALAGQRPKCLLPAGGETLVRRIVGICHAQGLYDISVVTGYRAELIETELGDSVTYFHNPLFESTNSLVSLWFAAEKLAGDVILMNADLFFEPDVLRLLLEQPRPAVMLSDSSRIATADYRFGFEADRICRYGKSLSDAETDGEYVGMAKVAGRFMPRFRRRLNELLLAQRVHDWWEEVLYSFIPEGVPIYHRDVAGLFWTEVDCQRDFDRLRNWVAADLAAA